MIKRSFTATARKALLRRGRTLLRRSERVLSASGRDTSDFLGGLSDAERADLTEIHKALERIERGIFGRCESCGDAIVESRLEARPWERTCEPCDSAHVAEPVHSEQRP